MMLLVNLVSIIIQLIYRQCPQGFNDYIVIVAVINCINNTVVFMVTIIEPIMCIFFITGALDYPLFGTTYDYLMNNEASTVITNPYCPPERFYDFYLGNCDFTLSSSTDGCSSYQPQPLLTCYQGMPFHNSLNIAFI